jgi:hypothetical protein
MVKHFVFLSPKTKTYVWIVQKKIGEGSIATAV